ncbi:unnamed protein product [Adineta steineri]|uniref:Sugar phosphate transporter domain-containing protein n=1 Tax=Adineta steineri TaxID=433720 RepID=A0A814DS27_9BILA|nr:unnamed protein product [Adineta steineri]CAF0962198.1 unnamed protein product [Adineta steineri]
MNDQDTDQSTTGNVKTKTILTLLLYCISGSLLTILNKLAIIAFPFINLLLVLQNGVTVILLLVNFYFCPLTLERLPPLNFTVLKIWIPVVLLFVMMLTSSLFALKYVSVPTVIVIRNLSTVSVAILEYFVIGNKIDILSIGTLFGMFFGAIVYALHDLTFSIEGYIWLCVNIIGTSLYQVYIKKVVHMPEMKDIGPISMSYYNNLISLLILFILACVMGELKSFLLYFQSIFLPKIKSICIVFLSCILGFTLSTSAFALNKLISPTSIMVANNVNKFALIILSEIFVQSTLDLTASIATIFVLFYGCYSDPNQAASFFIPSLIAKIKDAPTDTRLEIRGLDGTRDFITA